MKRPIYYDTETTGLSATGDRIVEIAAYDPVRDATYCSFVNPGMPIPEQASSVHHITDDMVQDAPGFDQVAVEFTDFCEGEIVLIAHNNDGFDIHFLREEYKRNGMELPQWNTLDTLKWARKYRPDLPRHSLQFLRETYGIPANTAHRALDDVIILHKVFSLMIDDLSMEMCLELLKTTTPAGVMPFGKHQGKPLADVPKDYLSWLKKSGALDKPENKELLDAISKL